METKSQAWLNDLENHIKLLTSSDVTRITLNGFGWHINKIDFMQQRFLEFAKTATKPIADLGVGFGYSTRALLEVTKTQIIANDLSQDHLDKFLETVTNEDQRSRLLIKQGNALKLDFQSNSLAGIEAIRWFYFLRPEEIRQAFALFYQWLSPGGKLFINAFSPNFKKLFGPFLPIYQERRERNELWPGLMEHENVCWVKSGISQDYGYVFDTEVFRREAELAGFKVECCEYYPHPEESSREEGKEMLGIIAVKPN